MNDYQDVARLTIADSPSYSARLECLLSDCAPYQVPSPHLLPATEEVVAQHLRDVHGREIELIRIAIYPAAVGLEYDATVSIDPDC